MSERTTQPDPRLRGMLVDALVLLTKPAHRQISWLAVTRVDADDVALMLDDVWPAARPLVHDEAAATIDQIDGLLRSMSGRARASSWTDDGLRSRPEWAKVRLLASGAVAMLGS